VFDVFWMQMDTRGGFSETVVNEDAAMPTGTPSINAHIAATPLG